MSIRTTTLIAGALLLTSVAPAGVELFTLGSIADRGDSVAFDINQLGQVVGQAENDRGVMHAFLWDNGVMTDLAPFEPDTVSNAWALNDLGAAVGYRTDRDGFFEALLWSGGSTTNLDVLTGSIGPSQVFDINNNGTMVGGFSVDGAQTKPTVLDASGNVIAQPTSGFNQAGFMRGINEAGMVVGHDFEFGTPDDAMFAFPDTEGGYAQPTKLQEQLGNDFFPFTLAYDVSESGIIVGTSNNGSGTSEAAMWLPDDEGGYDLHLLGTLGEQDTALAWGVNAMGVIVGQSRDEDASLSDPRAFMYLNGAMVDLNDFVDEDSRFTLLMGAHAINDAGDIVGFGRTTEGTVEAFVLRGAVPSPGAGALLVCAGMLMRRRRSEQR